MSTTHKNQIRHFIFGYGSLICEQSRKITAPTLNNKPAQPVTVHHLRRTWTARCRYDPKKRKKDIHQLILGQTAMGIEPMQGAQTTGVLIEVSESELAYFDQREGGYTRCEIDAMHIYDIYNQDQEDHEHDVLKEGHRLRRLSSLTLCDGPAVGGTSTDGTSKTSPEDMTLKELYTKVWVYIPNRPMRADSKYPIMQSYLDVIIRGCLNISEDFAIQYLQNTHGFDVGQDTAAVSLEKDNHHEDSSPSYVWIDDRGDPRYVRADKEWSSAMGDRADEILRKCHPRAVEKRQSIHNVWKKTG